MRVGLDYRPATVAPWSGIGRQVRALEDAISQRPDTELLRFSEAPLEHPQRETAHCPSWPTDLGGVQRPAVRWRFERRFLPHALRALGVDVYIATANMGLPVGGKGGRRQVLLLHDVFQLTERNYHQSKLKALVYRVLDTVSIAWSVWAADRVWCPSQFSADQAARLFPFARGKLRVLPNRVDAFTAEPERDAHWPKRYWLAVGTREPRKNIERFLRAWQAARVRSADVPALVLVGSAEDAPADLRQLPGLHWCSGISEGALHGLYAGAECLWQPSFAEGFGLPVVEALSCGTPVAVAHGSALDEVAPASSPRFDPHQEAAITQAMLTQASSPQPRDDASVQWARRYDAGAYAQRLDQLLMELER